MSASSQSRALYDSIVAKLASVEPFFAKQLARAALAELGRSPDDVTAVEMLRLVQEYVDDDYRGRVMAIFMMQFSLMSLGTFLVSLYMEKVGPEFALGSLGAVLVATTLVFVAVIPRIRRLD